MPTLLEFFTIERLMNAGATRALATRIRGVLSESMCDAGETGALSLGGGIVRTVEELLEAKRPDALLRTPKLGPRGASVIARSIEHANLRFRVRQDFRYKPR
jgi:hypothetical protein